MKLFFISDIHGSYYYLNKALEKFESEKADALIILGDELYHGARNPLPRDYSPKDVALALNRYANKIVAVRGNCDSEVDDMVLDYPILSTYSICFDGTRKLFLTHGHIYHEENLPRMSAGDVFFYGHTHIPVAKAKGELYIVNPGSISLPKEGSPNSFGILEEDHFKIQSLDGEIYSELTFAPLSAP